MPCWGTRHIKPEAGSLVIFPSHIFHDVVPSRTQALRIAVAAGSAAGREFPISRTASQHHTAHQLRIAM